MRRQLLTPPPRACSVAAARSRSCWAPFCGRRPSSGSIPRSSLLCMPAARPGLLTPTLRLVGAAARSLLLLLVHPVPLCCSLLLLPACALAATLHPYRLYCPCNCPPDQLAGGGFVDPQGLNSPPPVPAPTLPAAALAATAASAANASANASAANASGTASNSSLAAQLLAAQPLNVTAKPTYLVPLKVAWLALHVTLHGQLQLVLPHALRASCTWSCCSAFAAHAVCCRLPTGCGRHLILVPDQLVQTKRLTLARADRDRGTVVSSQGCVLGGLCRRGGTCCCTCRLHLHAVCNCCVGLLGNPPPGARPAAVPLPAWHPLRIHAGTGTKPTSAAC